MKKYNLIKALSLSAILVLSINTIGCNVSSDIINGNNNQTIESAQEENTENESVDKDLDIKDNIKEEIKDLEDNENSTEEIKEEVPELEIEEMNKKGYSKVELNIRKGPGKEYEVIGVLAYNDEIDITGKSDNWYRIKFNDLEGYVFATHISDTKLEEKIIEEDPVIENNMDETVEKEKNETPVNNSNEFLTRALNELNAYRAANGLGQVTLSGELNKAASIRAREAAGYFSHTRPNGTEFITVLNDIGYSNYSYAGENLIDGVNFSSSIVEYWKTSPSHNAAMLEPGYSQVGFAYAENPQGQLTVALILIEK